jgi:hypothetical protein
MQRFFHPARGLPLAAALFVTGPTAVAAAATPVDGGEIELSAEPIWTPHRLGFGGGALVAGWEHGATEPVFLGQESGGTYGVVRFDYHYMLNEWLGMGAALEIDIADSGYPGYAGFAAAVGLRIGLWKEWLYVEAETLTGYPWILGGVANIGFAFPIGSGVRVRLDSRFLFCLADDCPLQIGWFPAFAAEMAL